MKLITGDLWSELRKARTILVSTNSTTNSRGELIMGVGAAKEARDRFPGLAREFGEALIQMDQVGLVGKKYGILYHVVKMESDIIPSGFFHQILGAFQVKYHFRDRASLDLIEYSTGLLLDHAILRPHERFAMNFPGIGFGGRSEEEVLPIISKLPDNVFVYQK